MFTPSYRLALRLAQAIDARRVVISHPSPRRWYHNWFRPTLWEREWAGVIK